MRKMDEAFLLNQKFGRWTIKGIAHEGYVNCVCECGTERAVRYANLKRGITNSCGCYRSIKLKEVATNFHDNDDLSYMHKENEWGLRGVYFNGSTFGVKLSACGFRTPDEAHEMYKILKQTAREYRGKRKVHS